MERRVAIAQLVSSGIALVAMVCYTVLSFIEEPENAPA